MLLNQGCLVTLWEFVMGANLNAIGILLTVLFAIAVSYIWGKRPIHDRIFPAILVPFVISFLLLVLLPSGVQNPWQQLFIPVWCMFPILLFVERKAVKFSTSLVLLILAVVLANHRGSLIASHQEYTISFHVHNLIYKDTVELIKRELSYTVGTDSNSYPEGWLVESPLLARIPEEVKDDVIKRFEESSRFKAPITYKFWHSSFTGIYGVKVRNPDVWYPGGKLTQETIDKITLRER